MWNLANWGKVLISLIVVLGFLSILALLLTMKLQGTATPDVLLVMLGALATSFTAVVQYWVGSSQSSSAKDETIKEAVKIGAAQ